MSRIKHILGPSIPKSEAWVLGAMRVPKFQLFTLTTGALMGLLTPMVGLTQAPFLIQTGYWLLAAVLFLPIYGAFEVFFLSLFRRLGWTHVPEILLSVPTALIVAAITLPLLPLVGVYLTSEEKLYGVATSIVLLQGVSYIYIRFVHVLIFPELYEATTVDDMSPPPEGAQLFLRGTTLPMWKVEVIRADGPYTEVVAGCDVQRIRARFSTVIADLPTDLGFQIHRGIWISRNLVLGSRKDGRRISVRLPSGSMLPVARDREAEFTNWMSRQGPVYAAHVLKM